MKPLPPPEYEALRRGTQADSGRFRPIPVTSRRYNERSQVQPQVQKVVTAGRGRIRRQRLHDTVL
jgi:hypothetical protein